MKAINTKEIVKIVNKIREITDQLEWHRHRLERSHDEAQKRYIEEKEQMLKALREERETAEKPLSDAIREAEGKARERTVTEWTIMLQLRKVEDWLGLKKKDLEGVSVTINVNAQDFPRAYKWKPEATIFSATYKSGSWRITKIWRDDCRRYPKAMVTHTEQSKKALIEKYSEM